MRFFMRMIKHPYLYNKVKFGMLYVKFKSDSDKPFYLLFSRITGQINSSNEMPPCWKVFL